LTLIRLFAIACLGQNTNYAKAPALGESYFLGQ